MALTTHSRRIRGIPKTSAISVWTLNSKLLNAKRRSFNKFPIIFGTGHINFHCFPILVIIFIKYSCNINKWGNAENRNTQIIALHKEVPEHNEILKTFYLLDIIRMFVYRAIDRFRDDKRKIFHRPGIFAGRQTVLMLLLSTRAYANIPWKRGFGFLSNIFYRMIATAIIIPL